MASTSNQSTPTGSKLENATKEDLIKLLKRQQLLLKKHNTENETAKKAFKTESDALKCKIESSEALLSQMRRENEDIYTSNRKLGGQIEELKATIKHMVDEQEDTSSELLVLRETKDAMRDVVQEIQAENEKLQQHTVQLAQDRDSERGVWQEHIQSIQLQLTEKEKELCEYQEKETAAKQKASLQSDIVQAKSDITSLRRDGEELKDMIRQYSEQFTDETNTLTQVLSLMQNPELMRYREEVEKELEELKTYLREKQVANCDLTEENRTLKEELLTLKEELSSKANLSVEVAEVEVKSGTLGTAHVTHDATYQPRVKELESQLQERVEEIAGLERQLHLLQEDKRKINSHLDNFIEESATMKDEIRDMEDTEDRLTTTVQYLTDKEAVASQELEMLHATISTISHTISDKDADCDVLTSQLTALQEQYSELTHQHDQLLAHFQLLQRTVEERAAEGEERATATEELQEERDSLSSQVFLLEEQVEQITGDLESEKARTETLEHSARESAKELLVKDAQLAQALQQLHEATECNRKLKEDSQGSHNLMDMELADYQRAAGALEDKLNTSVAEVKELEKEVEIKEETAKRLKLDLQELEKQRCSLEEMVGKLKGLLLKTKKDAADARKAEDDAKRCENTIKVELEQTIQQFEDSKLELSEVTGKLSSLVGRSRDTENEKCALIKNLEQRVLTLQEDVEREKELRRDISVDFESYKVRVHSVLKQQKTHEATISLIEHETIVTLLSRELEVLKCRVHELKAAKDAAAAAGVTLEEEVQTLLDKLDKLERDSTQREQFYLERVGELEETLRKKEEHLYSAVESAAAQRAALTHSYTRTLEHSNTSHREAAQVLQSRICSLQEELAEAVHTDTGAAHTDTVHTDLAEYSPTPARPRIRLAAEGMESPRSAEPRTAGLEDLLNSSIFSRSSSRISESNVASAEESKLAHLRALLSESEHNAAALQEQCAVLKAEVRRVEKMLGRDHTNIEYLKNIVLKYISCTEVSGREQLVPVLCRVLHLTKEERGVLEECSTAGRREQVPWASSWFSSG